MPQSQNNDNLLTQAFNKMAENLNRIKLLEAICKELGISERTFYNYLSNPKTIKSIPLIKLCTLLQVDYLLLLNLKEYNTTIENII